MFSMEKIIGNIRKLLNRYDVKFLKFVDISDLPKENTNGLPVAVLFGLPLPVDFIKMINDNILVRYNMFDVLEERMKRVADFMEEYLKYEGYQALSQSDEEQLKRGSHREDVFRSRLPHKTLALRGGLGWIGKNDLCNTYDYGCAISMCSVLTDAPFETVEFEPPAPRCGKCTVCKEICPTDAISGTMWQPGVDRDELVDIGKCLICLKCLAICPFTKAKLKFRKF